MQKLLITGASGLLGGCLLRQADKSWRAQGCCFSNRLSGLLQLDLRNPEQLMKVVREGGYSHIIHCAALRSPDYCLDHQSEAESVNVVGTRNLAVAAEACNAHLTYISTDYVFSGDNPPYSEESRPDPQNVYGTTKLRGEHAASSVAEHLVVRIPALYRTDLSDQRSFVTEIARQLREKREIILDCETVRYYTLADDIAEAILFLLEQRKEGLWHLSADQKTSKYQFAKEVAERLGYSPALIVKCSPPQTGDRRPVDSHLCTRKYLALNGPILRGCSSALNALPRENNPATSR